MWMMAGALLVGIAAIVGGFLLREFGRIWVPLSLAINAQARGRHDAACRLYRIVIAKPTRLSEVAKRDARFRLSWLLMENGEYAEAVELLQTNLKARCAPTVESNARQRLAEALEGAGQMEAAEAERTRAGALLDATPNTAGKLLSEADMLSKQQKFTEAYAAYERGLVLVPSANTALRARVMAQLALSAFNCGQPQQAIQWGEQAVALKPGLTILLTAHSAAGLGYNALGQLEQAETHQTRALEIATNAGNQDSAARFTVQVAETRRRMGRLVEAMQMCEQAAGMSIRQRRSVYAVQYEILSNWGRFDEAAQVLEQAQRAQQFPTPSMQKRMQAVYVCETAMLFGERGLPEQGWPMLAEGLEGLRNDTKTATRFRAGGVWLLALLNRRDEVFAQAADVEAGMGDFAQDPATRRILIGNLGRAFHVLAEYERSLDCWRQYLALSPDPVLQPRGYYYAGSCLYHLGDTNEAKAMLEKALAFGIDTVDANRARRLLLELNTRQQVIPSS